MPNQFRSVVSKPCPRARWEHRMHADLTAVQLLPITEIAELWAPRLKIPKDIVIDELRLGYFKYVKSKTDRRFVSGVPLEYGPSEAKLPSVHERCISKEFMKLFCKYNRWSLPDFWFEPQRRPRGRPAIIFVQRPTRSFLSIERGHSAPAENERKYAC
jgi:hypothetical protein